MMNIKQWFHALRTTSDGFFVLQIIYGIVLVVGLLLSGLFAALKMLDVADVLETLAIYSFGLMIVNSAALAVGIVLFGNKTIFAEEKKGIFPWN